MKTKMHISCMLALILTAAAWAQVAPSSPQNDATAGLTFTEGDQFMSVTDWGSVSFNKAFAYIDYTAGMKKADIGAAFKAGPVYIGSYYSGNFGAFGTNANQQEVDTDPTLSTSGSTAGSFTNVKKTTKTQFGTHYDAQHTAAVLLGFGNMGFQFGYLRDGKNASGKYFWNSVANKFKLGTDTVETNTNLGGLSTTTNKTYDSKGFINKAKHTPFVAFGMNIPVGAITISPTAAVAVTINQSSRYGVETSDTKHNATAYQTVKSADKSKSDAYIGITGKLGAGIALGDSLHSSINIGYDFTVNAYGKTYKDLSGEKHKVKGTYNITTDKLIENYNLGGSGKHITEHRFEADMTKKTYFSNTLKPSYSIQKDFTDRLSLFAGVECPITVELDTSVLTKESKTVTKTKHLNPAASHLNTTVTEVVTSPTQTMKKTTVEVKPAAMAAITYAAIPNRLSFNLGTKINFLNGKHVYTKVSKSGVVKTTRTTTVYDNQGNRTTVNDTPSEDNAKEYVKKGGTLYAIGAEVKGGLKWNITENFIFDFVYAHFLEAGRMLDPGAFKIACTVKF